MEMPEKLSKDENIDEYLGYLRSYRDEALDRSRVWGGRRPKGRLATHIEHAAWRTEYDGRARLTHSEFRLFGMTATRLSGTELMLEEDYEGSGEKERIVYTMDLESSGRIEVFRHLFVNDSVTQLIYLDGIRHQEKKLGLLRPSEEEKRRLFIEMNRGASGMHVIDAYDD